MGNNRIEWICFPLKRKQEGQDRGAGVRLELNLATFRRKIAAFE
jgi:hypothetical protein